MNRILLYALAAGLAAGPAGCDGNKGPVYTNVSGTITVNGKPLDKGTITFTSDGRPPTQAEIVDGKYAGQAIVGANKVAISARRKAAAAKAMNPQAKAMMDAQLKGYAEKGPPGSGGGGMPIDSPLDEQETLPAEWNTASKHVREVAAGAQNAFDFDIKTKN
jgi:hypothetical protein